MNASATPLYFASGEDTLFGWVHRPTGASSDVGLVICKPFGYEAVCAHNSLRAFAASAAVAGATVLRFDYVGTGDSSDGDSRADQIELWCRDVRAAVGELRKLGMRRIVLLGMRLGALLAGLVCEEDGIDGLILLAPVVSGRRYLRELRAFQAAATVGIQSTGPPRSGELEVAGFYLSAASVERVGRIEASAFTRAAAKALIMDRDDLPAAATWASRMSGLGSQVDYQSLPGFSEMVSTPHAAQVPQAMLQATVGWLQTQVLDGAATLEANAETAPEAFKCTLSLPLANGGRLEEEALYVDAERRLFAIITRPVALPHQQPVRGGFGVVMLNGGATSHIGPNRMYVELARRWAARGYAVLRLDLAGLGDSAARPGRLDNDVYPSEALQDVAASVDFLRRHCGVNNVTLAGLCAGAYHALRSAMAGLPVSTVLLVNPLTFYWKQGSTLNDLQISEVVRNPGIYAEKVFNGSSWLKLLQGRVNLWRVMMIFLRRAWLACDSLAREISRRLRIRLPDDLGWDLQTVASRGVRIVFLFARGDAGENLLRVQGGSVVNSIGERCRVHTIDGADHVFSQGPARRKLLQLLGDELPQ